MTIQEFQYEIYKLQVKYSSLVVSHFNKIHNGKLMDFKKLSLFRKQLIILNKFDTRDINNIDPQYNILSFNDIKKIIHRLNNY